ncbi:hypothetical protein Nmel_000021 [Mimus melanotis]
MEMFSLNSLKGLAGGAGPAQLIPGAAKAGRWLWRSCLCCLTLLSAK